MSNLVIDSGVLVVTAESLTDADFSSGVNQILTIAKQRHELTVEMRFDDSTDITALSQCVHIARAAGTVTAVEITPNVAPTGGNKKWTVDVLRSTGAAAFATILTAAKDIDNATSDRTPVVASLDSTKTDYVDSDILQIVVTVTGSTGSQGQGGVVKVWLDEGPG